LDLLPHRVVILEMKGREGTDLDPPTPIDLGDPAAVLTPHNGVFGDRSVVVLC